MTESAQSQVDDNTGDGSALDRCICTHWHTSHLARDRSGNFVGVNRGACVECGCDNFRSGYRHTAMTPDTAATVTNEMLSAAYEKYRAASLDSVLLSLLALAQGARETFPQVRTIQFEWSDQGSFLSLSGLLDADGNDLDPDFTFNGDSLDSNLADSCQGQWDQFMTDADGGGEIGRRTRRMNLDVDRALAIELPDTAIKVLHVRDSDGVCAAEVYVAGKRVTDAYVEDVDPGRGYQWSGWRDRLADACLVAVGHPDDEFATGVYQALLAAAESEHVKDKPANWREEW